MKYPLLETRIAVEAIVYAESYSYGSHSAFDIDGESVLFIGTDLGFVLTVVMFASSTYKLVDVRNIYNGASNCGNGTESRIVRDIKLVATYEMPSLYVAFDECIVNIPATNCTKADFCSRDKCSKYVRVPSVGM